MVDGKTLYIVDISSFVFRAYYAIRPLRNSKGLPTHATYGVISMLLKLLRQKKPSHLIIAFDSGGPSFRKKIYDEYKANRVEVPEDLPPQFDSVRQFVKAYPFTSFQAAEYEADDVIATIVRRVRAEEHKHFDQVVIVSADKDLMQLVGPDVCLYDSMKEKAYDVAGVIERFGVSPDKVIDVLALAGDSSDNIPGVAGIGEKTAIKLIQQWGSVENTIASADQITGKMGEKVKAGADMALLSKRLVALADDIPLAFEVAECHLRVPDVTRLNAFYREMEFKNMVVDDGSGESVSADAAPASASAFVAPSSIDRSAYELILTEDQLAAWAKSLTSDGFAFDTETDGLDPLRANLVGISLARLTGGACYIPVAHSYLGCPSQIPIVRIRDILGPVFADIKIPKCAQNARYDCHVLERAGMPVLGLRDDSLIASYMIDPEESKGLDYLAQKYLNHSNIAFDDVVPKKSTFDAVEVEKACVYAAEDADVTARIMPILTALVRENGLEDCYRNIEMPLIEVLRRMESTGVYIDAAMLLKLGDDLGARLQIIQSEIYKLAGCEFNILSPKQLAEILFVKLGLPSKRKTKTGFSTDVDVLTELSTQHALPAMLLEHRSLSKLKSTYVDQLWRLLHKDGRIHTHYNQTVAATGRLSSTDPNLQNIPIRTEDGKKIREAFLAPEGHVILAADYSQIELRLLAAFTKDPVLMEAFQKDEDVHRMTAIKVFGLKPEDVTSQHRSMAKTVNFGVIYGQSAFGLAQLLGIPAGEAKKYIEEFFAQFPNVAAFKERTLAEARRTGEVRTWSGRRRLVRDITSGNVNVRGNAERAAFNTIFQGSAADLIKAAMIKIDHLLLDRGDLKTKMIMQVHDELVFEVPEDKVAEVTVLVKHEMQTAMACEVPLKVDVGVGNNWAEAH